MMLVAPLVAHVAGGLIAIGSGWVAVMAKKGERLHRLAGTVFTGAMLLMATMATFMAFALHERGNIGAGLLALYLIATAWMAARRKDGVVGWFEYGALIAVLAIAVTYVRWGAMAAESPKGLDGYRPVLFYVFGSVAAFLALMDVKTIRSGGLSGAARIARHLWRMCLAFFLASASFFLGQQKVMPKAWHGSPILLLLGLAPLAFLIFWMIRIRLFNRRRSAVTMAAPAGT